MTYYYAIKDNQSLIDGKKCEKIGLENVLPDVEHPNFKYLLITEIEYKNECFEYFYENGEIVKRINYSIEIEVAKLKKIEEIKKHWGYVCRVMVIENGHLQPILADQDFINNLDSAKSQADLVGFYSHQLRDKNNIPILENGNTVNVKMTKNLLIKIGQIVETRRGLCNRSEAIHKLKCSVINSIDGINKYNYFLDDNGNELKNQTIKIKSTANNDIYDDII